MNRITEAAMTILRRVWALVRPVFTCLGLCWFLVTVTPLTNWWIDLLAGSWDTPKADCLIVLGAEPPEEDGIIARTTYWRSVYAVRAWRAGGVTKIVVVGGGGGGASMKAFMVAAGVPEHAVLAEGQSTSTRENALFCRQIVRGIPGRKALVTSDYHMFRAIRAFRKAGIDVVPYVVPDAMKRVSDFPNDGFQRWGVFAELCRETGKLLGYRLLGWA